MRRFLFLLLKRTFLFFKRKNCLVKRPLEENFWVSQINFQNGFDTEDLQQFVTLWELVSDVQLDHLRPDTIKWKFTKDGIYTASSAYNMQFKGLVSTTYNASIWKVWAPPKCKIFAWLATQDMIWTSDSLQRRGWNNCGNCPLYNQVQESGAHLLYKCRFTLRIWKEVLAWCGIC
jgi:hypothetical protein